MRKARKPSTTLCLRQFQNNSHKTNHRRKITIIIVIIIADIRLSIQQKIGGWRKKIIKDDRSAMAMCWYRLPSSLPAPPLSTLVLVSSVYTLDKPTKHSMFPTRISHFVVSYRVPGLLLLHSDPPVSPLPFFVQTI